MFQYEVGKTVEDFKNNVEGVNFDINDNGATMLVFFQNPTEEEIEQFKSGNNFEIRFTELYDVIMITVKIGNLNWMDAPYSPHLSKNLKKFQIPNEGQGLALTLVLVDSATGEIKNLRLLSLSERFTRRFLGTIMEQKTKEFDEYKYNNSINKIFTTYQTNQIVKLSKEYCKINN